MNDTLYCPFEKNCDFYKSWADENNNRKDVINVSFLEQKEYYSCLALRIEDIDKKKEEENKIKFQRIKCAYIYFLDRIEQRKK